MSIRSMFGGQAAAPNPPSQQPGGSPGGSDSDEGQQNQQNQQNQQLPGQQGESGEDVDILSSLFSDDEGDGDEGDAGQQNQQHQQQPPNQQQQQQEPSDEQRLVQELTDAIKNMSIPEDAVPENFDPSDPKQMRDFLGKIQQQTAAQTIQLALKPMQLAVEKMTQTLRDEIKEQLNSHSSNQSARQILESVVPEAKSEEHRGLVNMLWEQSRKKTKKPQDAAQMVRKALDAMGVKSRGGKRGGNQEDPSSEGFKTGAEALDLYAAMPKS